MSVGPAVAARAQEAFTRPVVRFAVTGAGPEGFALTVVKNPDVALLSRLCVDPAVASHGLGAALVTDAVEHARTAGYQRVELDVRQSNTRAIAVYVRTGFHPSSAPWRVDEGDPVVTWTRQLTNPLPPDDAGGGVARFGR